MRRINGLKEGLELFRVLGSEVRMQIITLLSENSEMNLGEISTALNLTHGAITTHIRRLQEQDLIRVETRHSARGLQKVCSLKDNEILLDVYPAFEEIHTKVYEASVRIGEYSGYSALPGCGMITENGPAGAEDDPQVFSRPERLNAQMLWLHDGFVEYRIPNLLPERHKIVQLTISSEMSCSEQGSGEDISSNIRYYLNDKRIGVWDTSMLDRSLSRGIFTPAWWTSPIRQHGYLKMLVINSIGIFIDGVKIQGTGADWPFVDPNGQIRFRIESHPEEGREGGLALYGPKFGNYNQNIQAIVHYMPEGAEASIPV